jgi:hypothetical protein
MKGYLYFGCRLELETTTLQRKHNMPLDTSKEPRIYARFVLFSWFPHNFGTFLTPRFLCTYRYRQCAKFNASEVQTPFR